MTFGTIKADNGKFMGFDILGGERRGRQDQRERETSDQGVGRPLSQANIKT